MSILREDFRSIDDMPVLWKHSAFGQNQIKSAIFCVTYELLFYRNITKLLRFPLFLLGAMLWPAFWSMVWLSPSLFSIAETPCKTNTGCKTGFEMPYWNFEAYFPSKCFLPPPPPICQRSCDNLGKRKSVLWEQKSSVFLFFLVIKIKVETKTADKSTEQNHLWKAIFKLNAHVATVMKDLNQAESFKNRTTEFETVFEKEKQVKCYEDGFLLGLQKALMCLS